MSEVINVITGTGRCGSTILSRLIMHHPDVLVLREFLSGAGHRSHSAGEISGKGLATILGGGQTSLQSLYLPRGYSIPEVIYRLSDAEKKQPRWNKPGILLAALHYICDNPDTLYEELLEWARRQPTAPLSVHYPKVFRFLLERTGRKMCIEASAGGQVDFNLFSSRSLRIVHIHRDGPETVLSMYHHAHFKLLASFLLDPPTDEELRAAVDRTVSDDEDVVHRREKADNPNLIPLLASMWTSALAMLYHNLVQIPPENYLAVNFEDVLADPKKALRRIAEFFKFPDRGDDWLSDAVPILKDVKLRVPELPAEQQELLQQLCRTGHMLLGRDPKVSPPAIEERLYTFYGLKMEPLV